MTSSNKRTGRAITIVVLVLCCIGLVGAVTAFVLMNASTSTVPAPQRVTPTVSPSSDGPTVPPTPSPETPVVIEASDILSVAMPAVGLNVKVSGETQPRQTDNCKETTVCIDPPVADQAAWYSNVPSTPDTPTVRLFGHTSYSNPHYATFNSLVVAQAGDEIIVTTETGIFTYTTLEVTLVPYREVPNSQLIYKEVPGKVVLITCNRAEHSATVVVGELVRAEAR